MTSSSRQPSRSSHHPYSQLQHHHQHQLRRPSTMPPSSSTPQSPRDDQPFVSAPPPPPHHPHPQAHSHSSDALPRQTTPTARPISSGNIPHAAATPSANTAQWRQSVHSLRDKKSVELAAAHGQSAAVAAVNDTTARPATTLINQPVKRGAALPGDYYHHASRAAVVTSLPPGAVTGGPSASTVNSNSPTESGVAQIGGTHSHYVRQRQEKDKAQTAASRRSPHNASPSSPLPPTTHQQPSSGLQLTTGPATSTTAAKKKRSPASTSSGTGTGTGTGTGSKGSKMIAHASSMIGLGIDSNSSKKSPRAAHHHAHAHKASDDTSSASYQSSGADEPRASTSTSGSSGRGHLHGQQQQGQQPQQHIRVSYGGDDFYFATPPGSSPDPEFSTTLPQPHPGLLTTTTDLDEAVAQAYRKSGGGGGGGGGGGSSGGNDARAAPAPPVVTSSRPSGAQGAGTAMASSSSGGRANAQDQDEDRTLDATVSPNDVKRPAKPTATIRERRRQDKAANTTINTAASPPPPAAMSTRNAPAHYTGQLGGQGDAGPFEHEGQLEETIRDGGRRKDLPAVDEDHDYADEQEIDSEDDSLLSDEGSDDGDTEQAHNQDRPFSPPSVISSNDSPIIRVGKGGSRAGAAAVPNRNSSMIQPGQQQQAPLPPSKAAAPSLGKQQQQPAQSTRRVAGGLSRSGTNTATATAGSTAMTPSSSLGSRSMAAAASRPAAPTRINSTTSSAGGKPSSITSTSRKRGEFYRSAAQIGRRTNLTDWAPRARTNNRGLGGGDSSYGSTSGAGVEYEEDDEAAGIENLPRFSSLRPGDQTSKPISRVEKDMEWSLCRLLSEDVFKRLLDDPLGRHRFREFLDEDAENGAPMLLDDGSGGGDRPAPGSELLDFYFDLGQYERQAKNLKSATEAIHDLYMAEDSPSHIPLPPTSGDDLYGTLRRAFDVEISLNPLQENIRRHLYRTSFQRFVRSMLIEENRVKLGAFQDEDDDYAGLGDCFCLTNPRAGTENPIVLASPGFAEVTGYPIKAILGRNCRFLQGPGTAPESVQRIRDALNAGRSCTEVLLNYRRDGTPFFCLLSIIPLRDAAGQLAYFIGGQTNVSGTLAADRGLGFLVGNGIQSAQPSPESHNGYEVSPTMSRHLLDLKQRDGGGSEGVGRLGGLNTASSASLVSRRGGGARNDGSVAKRRPAAAGAYDPSSSRGPVNDAFAQQSSKQSSSRSSKGGIMSRLFGGGNSSSSSPNPSNGPPAVGSVSNRTPNLGNAGGGPKQRLLGAEGVVRNMAPARLGDQMESFTDLYSRLIVFKRHRREIIFATVHTIQLLNLPCSTAQQAYRSPLLHADVLDLMRGASKQETRELRSAVRDAVKMGRQVSVRTGLRVMRKSGASRFVDRVLGGGANSGGGDLDGGLDGAAAAASEDMIIVTLHLTPLVDRENSSFAYVAVLG